MPRRRRRASRWATPCRAAPPSSADNAPASDTCRLLARAHAAPESTLALTKPSSLACERVRPLAWCSRPVTAAAEEMSGIDILVNAAGLALGRDPFDASTEDHERTVLETNVNGLIRMTRLCLPHLRDGGYIVNLGSVAGRQAYEKGSLYVTSKFAVRGFTYALREDLLGRPIHITTVDPGLVQTDFSLVRFRGDEETARKVYEGVEAMQPQDIADCIVFVVTRPSHVNVDELVVKALAQSSGGRILRTES